MFTLYVQAPFARFQHFVGGKWRPTADFITPSAAFGLVLNLASIDMREGLGTERYTQIKPGVADMEIALGALEMPAKQRVLQHLHTYAQQPTGVERVRADDCRGHPHMMSPCWRETLVGIRAYVAVKPIHPANLEEQVRYGLAGKLPRYGVPFLGDSNYILDVVRMANRLEPAMWFEQVPGDQGGMPYVTRLTVTIDRNDSARTVTSTFCASKPCAEVPPAAWVRVKY